MSARPNCAVRWANCRARRRPDPPKGPVFLWLPPYQRASRRLAHVVWYPIAFIVSTNLAHPEGTSVCRECLAARSARPKAKAAARRLDSVEVGAVPARSGLAPGVKVLAAHVGSVIGRWLTN